MGAGDALTQSEHMELAKKVLDCCEHMYSETPIFLAGEVCTCFVAVFRGVAVPMWHGLRKFSDGVRCAHGLGGCRSRILNRADTKSTSNHKTHIICFDQKR